MFKWVCLLVAVVALAAYGWMLNDMRLEVKNLAAQADRHLPAILTSAERLTVQLDSHLPRLLSQTETATTIVNNQLPKLLSQAEIAAAGIDAHLPRLLKSSEQAAVTLDTQLPRLITSTEATLDSVSGLTASFGQYKGLMGVVHATAQDKGLLSYASSVLSFVEATPATVGLKKAGPEPGLRSALPAKAWAAAAKKDVHFLSLAGNSKAEVLHGLARTNSPGEWHIQVGGQAPRALADWIRDLHPESKDVQ